MTKNYAVIVSVSSEIDTRKSQRLRRCVVLRLLGLLTLILTSCSPRQPVLTLTAKPVTTISDAKPGLDIARVALASGALTTAEHVAAGVLAQSPDDVDALLIQSEALRQAGDIFGAESSVKQAYNLKPRNIQVLIELGKIQLGHDAETAETTFRRAVAVDANDQAAMTDLGVSLDMQGKHRDAQMIYRGALSIGSGDQLATRVDLGLSLALTGDSQQALDQLRPAAAVPNVNSRVRQDLAAALTLAGDKRGAEVLLGHDMSQEQVASLINGYEALR